MTKPRRFVRVLAAVVDDALEAVEGAVREALDARGLLRGSRAVA